MRLMTMMTAAPTPSFKRFSTTSTATAVSRFTSLCLLLVLISFANNDDAAVNALNVAVTGATGRVGRLVVDRCLKSGHDVTAIVRNIDKANDLFSDLETTTTDVDGGTNGSNGITIRQLDFADLASKTTATSELVEGAFEGVDQVIWCASGFVDIPDDDGDGEEKTTTKESLDVVGMTHLLPSLSSPLILGADPSDTAPSTPSFIMLSSAGVTRPSWDDAKKAKLVGCADIPIVRMNPGGILGKKVVAEDMLRRQQQQQEEREGSSVIPYCIVRPTGLKFEDSEWPRGRSLFSQGDVAVGRMNANDLADLLVDLLNEPSATGKTFECVTLAGYPPSTSLSPVLDRLEYDNAATTSDDDSVYTAYMLMQQLLPGENQDATRLEMGRTYEQVDSGDVQARTRGAAPTEREIELASSVVNADEGKTSIRRKIKSFFGRSSST